MDAAPPAPVRPGRLRWPAAGAVAAALAALLLFVGLASLMFFQDAFIYFPSRGIHRTPADLGIPFEDLRLTTADGVTIAAWLVPAPRPAATLLFLHGNGGNRSDRLDKVAALRRAGLSTLIVDYRGYGESGGRPSEEGLNADARACWDHLVRPRGEAAAGIVLYGESLGSAPALELDRRLRAEGAPGPKAIVLEGPFTSALEMGRRAFPLLPLGWILTARMDNLAAVREVVTPLLILHGAEDEVAPVSMGRRLHEASASPIKEMREVPGARHNVLWETPGAEVPGTILAFLRRVEAG